MSSAAYLRNILMREAVDTGPKSPVLTVAVQLMPIIQKWAGAQLVDVRPSGSFAKGTANASGTDIDLFISLHETTSTGLREIYSSLAQAIGDAGYKPRLQDVSVNVKVNAYDVDLVPAKRQNNHSLDHSLYRRRADTWTKTNVDTHIATVRSSGRTSEVRILKLWRNQKGLDFPSFYLELATAMALSGKNYATLDLSVWDALAWLRDNIVDTRIVDPANTANVISDDLGREERVRISAVAKKAREAKNWVEVVR